MSHVTWNELFHAYKCVISQTWMSHVTLCARQKKYIVPPIADTVSQNLEILSKNSQLSTRRNLEIISKNSQLSTRRMGFMFPWDLYWKACLSDTHRKSHVQNSDTLAKIWKWSPDSVSRYLQLDVWDYMKKLCHTYALKMSCSTHMNGSCHTYEWVMSHIWMGHVTHVNGSRHTHGWVLSAI